MSADFLTVIPRGATKAWHSGSLSCWECWELGDAPHPAVLSTLGTGHRNSQPPPRAAAQRSGLKRFGSSFTAGANMHKHVSKNARCFSVNLSRLSQMHLCTTPNLKAGQSRRANTAWYLLFWNTEVFTSQRAGRSLPLNQDIDGQGMPRDAKGCQGPNAHFQS